MRSARRTRTRRPASRSRACAIQVPARQIAVNAGADGSIVVGKVMDQTDYATGWNAQTGEYTISTSLASSTSGAKVVRIGPSGRRVGGGPPRHHRGPDRREAC